MTAFLLLVGLALLLVGGSALVKGASGLASEYGVPPLAVGLTVVAFGTSAPELVVNIIGALRHQTDLAFGNVVGSNLANMGLVLGIAALLKPMTITGQVVHREVPLLLLGTSVLLVMTLDQLLLGTAPVLSRSDGLILLLLFSIFAYITVSDLLVQVQDPIAEKIRVISDKLKVPVDDQKTSNWIYVAVGTLFLTLGGHLTITYGAELAETMGLPPVVVGMIFVAIGTSLPELVTSVIAAWRNESDLCVGNVIGSNLFNSLFVLPISSLIVPLPIPEGGIGDILLTLVLSAVLIPVFFYGNARMDRKMGGALLATYFGYMAFRVIG